MQTAVPSPSLLGLRPSFGFGDRLGLATPGHMAACKLGRLAPIFAQQSARELTRTQRTAPEVLRCAQEGIVLGGGWEGPWGADADHLKTPEDVAHYAAAGFTFFTIDPSAFVQNQADQLAGNDLMAAVEDLVAAGVFESAIELDALYRNKGYDIGIGPSIRFERESLFRAAVKYGKAIQHASKMAAAIASATGGRFEIEMSVDETDSVTRPIEHLFVGLELKRRGIPIVSLAPRFVGEFEKGVDYKGPLEVFESQLKEHVAVARFCGPYKISVHSGSDKFSIYPIVGRICGDLLHVKTAGTNYLEALRVVCRASPELFREIIVFALGRFDADRASYHISATLDAAKNPATLSVPELEPAYLDESCGRQILHVTFGSVLTIGKASCGRGFRERIVELLRERDDLHREILIAHLGKHVRLLSSG